MSRSRRRPSLRLRITAGAAVVVLVAVGAAGFAVISVLEHEMVDQIDAGLVSTADFMDRVLRSGEGLPTEEGPADLYVQFIGPEGDVLGASDAAADVPPLVRPDPSGGRGGASSQDVVSVDDAELGRLRVLTVPSPTSPGVTIVVARSAEQVVEVRDSLERLVVIATLGLTVFLAVVIWVVVGRALRPVDAMARSVGEPGDEPLHVRVERPGTGDELDRLADVLNGLLNRLDEAVDRQRRFVSDASHELRTPVAALRALLDAEPGDPASGSRLEAIVRLGQLQDLIDGLLALSRADEGAPVDEGVPVDLDDLVLGHARRLDQRTSLSIDISAVSGGQVIGGEADLDRVIENLAANAARFARRRVTFSVRQSGGHVEVAVSDDGPGIAEADRARVFERFTTLDDARSGDHAGVGLGLAIAAGIVDAHGGSIRADAASGGGARFTVLLPAANGPMDQSRLD